MSDTRFVNQRAVGTSVLPDEAIPLVEGFGRFLNDIQLPGTYHVAFLRSQHAHARLRSVDASKARMLPGVIKVLTGSELLGKVVLVGGNETCVLLQHGLQDDLMSAAGLGPLGPSAGLPGDPADDRGWSFTGWYDTTEAQTLLDFQEHDWSQTLAWIAESQGRVRIVLRLLAPLLRPALRAVFFVQRRFEGRGPYADPWSLIEKKYGTAALATVD